VKHNHHDHTRGRINARWRCLHPIGRALHQERYALEAAKLMRDGHIGNVVIVNERDGRTEPIGVASDRDIVVQLVAKEVDPVDIMVTDLMARELFVALENEDIHEAIQRMRYRGVRRLPVVDRQGALVGVIALDDLLEHIADELTGIARISSRGRHAERR
jgi:predicted transcriptional regulator